MPGFPLAVGTGVGRGLRGPTIWGAVQFGEELSRQQNLGDRRGLLKGVLLVATWVVTCDRLTATRRFEIHRVDDGSEVLRATIDFVCVDLERYRPRRMPQQFFDRYGEMAVGD